MAGGSSVTVVRDIQTLFDSGTASGLSDRQLLERFVNRHDAEASFEVLVRRHGPMVLRVCQNLLRRSQRRPRCLSGDVFGFGPAVPVDERDRIGRGLAIWRGLPRGGAGTVEAARRRSRRKTSGPARHRGDRRVAKKSTRNKPSSVR